MVDEASAVEQHVGFRACDPLSHAGIVQGIQNKGFDAVRHISKQIRVHIRGKDLRAFGRHCYNARSANALACGCHKCALSV